MLYSKDSLTFSEFSTCVKGEQFLPDFITGNLPENSVQEKIRNVLFLSIKKEKIFQKRKHIRTDDRGIFAGWQKTEHDKDQLIVEFLSNLYFRFGQLYYTNLNKAIKELLDKLIEGDSEPIYNAFYMDFRAWLRERRSLSHSDVSINAFLQECKNKYISFREANGVSKHLLEQRVTTVKEVHFQRKTELYQLANFTNSGHSTLLIHGTAGSGRLSLIKHFFFHLKKSKQLNQDNFIVIDGSRLNREVIRFIHIPFLKFLIIYNVEYALQDTKTSQYLRYLIDHATKDIKVLLIALTENINAVNAILPVSKYVSLEVSPLSLDEVMSRFPFLKKYAGLSSVVKLITNPAKLKLIITFWEQLDEVVISKLNEQNLTNYIIDTIYLIKIIASKSELCWQELLINL